LFRDREHPVNVLRLAPLLVLAAGCVPVPVPVQLPQPRNELSTESHLEPIERLGRFEGSEFIPIEPGSIPPSHLYVITHGWEPGWDRAIAENPDLRCWQDPECEPWMRSLAQVILDSDPHAIVLSYSWLDDAATMRVMFAQRNALANTDRQGRWMAEAITQALGDDFIDRSGRMHFVGHSYGARVIALAAFYLPKRPQSLTLFDPPDAPLAGVMGGQTHLADLLGKLNIGRGEGEIFVDNYVSMVGRQYRWQPRLASVIDVVLTAPYSQLSYRDRHLYPMSFYAQTGDEEFGLGWSPLIAHGQPLPGCYQQPYGEIALSHGCDGIP
jgi:pimeloyl-ACP methyl ester carboxylesterase